MTHVAAFRAMPGRAAPRLRPSGRQEEVTEMRTFIIAAALATFVLGCGNGSDIDELKKGQKDILAKLEGLDKSVQQMKAAPAGGQRPQSRPEQGLHHSDRHLAPARTEGGEGDDRRVRRLSVSVLRAGGAALRAGAENVFRRR